MNNICLISNNMVFKDLNFPLYHVGTMDISKKSNSSYEGNGLSVSMCPSAWESIAEIGGSDIWKISKDNVKLLDYHKLSKKTYDDIIEWGVLNGYLKEVFGRYGCTVFSEDMGRDINCLCDNLNDALSEVGLEDLYFTYEDYLDSEDGYEDMIYPVRSFKATDKLISESLITPDEGLCSTEQNFLLYVEKYTDYDGVYWNENLDPIGLTAPRGVIFNSKIDSFNKELLDVESSECIENQMQYL